MDKIREAMEVALKEHWDAAAHAAPTVAPVLSRLASVAIAAAPAAAVPARTPIAADLARISAAAEAARMPAAAEVAEVSRAARPKAAPQRAPARTPASTFRWARVSAETFMTNRLIAAIAEHPQREHYCLLQADVAERLAGKEATVLGVTGPRSGDGKSLTAANLAISLARDGHREVLLIDLDLARPSVHALFGVDAGAGIEGVLFGGAAYADVLCCPSIEGLVLLPARGGSRAAAEILRSSSLKTSLTALKAAFPSALFVIDLPPIASRGDAAALEALVDAVLLVAEDGVTREADYRLALGSLNKSKLLGTVLNCAEPSR